MDKFLAIKFCNNIKPRTDTLDRKVYSSSIHIHALHLFCFAIENNSVVFSLEPFHGIFFNQAVRCSNMSSFTTPVGNIHTSTSKYNIEVHTINSNGWIILDSQINMFLDTKPKVTVGRKIIPAQFILTNLN